MVKALAGLGAVAIVVGVVLAATPRLRLGLRAAVPVYGEKYLPEGRRRLPFHLTHAGDPLFV